MKKTYQSRNSGSALVFAVFAVIILSVMGGGLLSLGFGSRVFALRDAQQIQARSAADAGLTKALFEVNKILQTNSWNNPSMPRATDEILPNCAATYSYKIVANSLKTKNAEHYVTSIGKSGQIVKTVYVTIALKGLFDSSIAVKDRMSLMPGTLITGYNSQDSEDTDHFFLSPGM